MKSVRLALTLALSMLAACTTQQPRSEPGPSDEEDPSPPPEAISSNPVEALGLKVVMNDQTTSGRVMKMRGKIVNPHSEEVTGVRIQLVFLAPTGNGMKILEIQQKEMGSTIPPGGAIMLSWDVESMYLGSQGRFLVAAYPTRLGTKDMPPPDHWQE